LTKFRNLQKEVKIVRGFLNDKLTGLENMLEENIKKIEKQNQFN